jgi:hypothetical protein
LPLGRVRVTRMRRMTLLLTATMMLLFLLFAGCKGGEGARAPVE